MSEIYPFVIVGAGPAGSALAYFLARQNLEVLLLDKARFPREKTCGDALSPRALRVLRDMGLLEPAQTLGFKVTRFAFFVPNGRIIEAPIPATTGQPDFSLVIPRYQLDPLLCDQAAAAGAEFRPQVEVTDVLREGEQVVGVRAQTPGGPVEIHARQTVLATGANLTLLQRAGWLSRPLALGHAARAYYTGVSRLSDCIEFHFEAAPLPGYGWVFPTSPTSANVGAGYLVKSNARWRQTPRQMFTEFTTHPRCAPRLANAHQIGPVKSYPLRFDFATAPLAAPGLAAIGEAAGLVNPLSGEGIDYALESAELAAEALAQAIRQNTPPAEIARRHTATLHAKFMGAFTGIRQVRDLYLTALTLNRLEAASRRYNDLKSLLTRIALGQLEARQALTLKTLWQIIRG